MDSVFAHATLVHTTPSNGEIVKVNPYKITLEFSEPLEPDLIDLKLYDWNGHQIKIKRPKLTPGNVSQMYAEVPKLNEGTYTAAWSIVSEDGHPVEGSYSFSVGKITAEKMTAPDKPSYHVFTVVLIILRFLIEGTILLGGGLYWLAWYAEKYNLATFTDILGRFRYFCWVMLLITLICEYFVYSATLPGESFISAIFEGRWELIIQSPFVTMILIQLVLIVLLAIPGMVESWYLFIWLLLISVLALGGHAWGTKPVEGALILRIMHLYTVAIWLGGLTYLVLLLRWKKRNLQEINLSSFRFFFVRMAVIATCGATVTGLAIVTMQTSWALLLQKEGGIWSILLFLKIVLFFAMLVVALKQTMYWARDGQSLLKNKLKLEWLLGIIIVLAGVSMSQIPYPHSINSKSTAEYINTLSNESSWVTVEIAQLYLGNQKMNFTLQNEKREEPQEIKIILEMKDMDMGVQEITVKRISSGYYQAELPFTMKGRWKYKIDFNYPDGTHTEVEDTIKI